MICLESEHPFLFRTLFFLRKSAAVFWGHWISVGHKHFLAQSFLQESEISLCITNDLACCVSGTIKIGFGTSQCIPRTRFEAKTSHCNWVMQATESHPAIPAQNPVFCKYLLLGSLSHYFSSKTSEYNLCTPPPPDTHAYIHKESSLISSGVTKVRHIWQPLANIVSTGRGLYFFSLKKLG